MTTYSKSGFRSTRQQQYVYFKKILNYSILGIALILIFLMLMLRFVWT